MTRSCRALFAMLHLAALAMPQERLFEAGDLPARKAVAKSLAAALAAPPAAELPAQLAAMRSACAEAATALPASSQAQLRLQAALAAADQERTPARALARLRDEADELVFTLQFQPLIQAELAAGFPAFQAVDELELRHYPAYRMARVPMRGGANAAFWPLFRHIESHGIPMTTPVQIDWRLQPEDQRPQGTTMAFLYGSPTTGKAGQDGSVEVVDVPAMTVLSIGSIGTDKEDRITALRARIDAFLRQHQDRYEAAGPLRTLGYNSPMVARDRRYFEVQLPVRSRVRKGPAV